MDRITRGWLYLPEVEGWHAFDWVGSDTPNVTLCKRYAHLRMFLNSTELQPVPAEEQEVCEECREALNGY
jgi:hypothetical protein